MVTCSLAELNVWSTQYITVLFTLMESHIFDCHVSFVDNNTERCDYHEIHSGHVTLYMSV